MTPLRARRRNRRLGMEQLEERQLLATVNSTQDVVDPNDGMTSLREAITAANATPEADVIDFKIRGVISLASPLPALTGTLTIVGPGAGELMIDGGASHRIFHIDSMGVVAIDGLTLRLGYSSFGGAIRNDGSLALSNSVLRDNRASATLGGPGGAIYSSGSLTVVSSRIVANQSVAEGGGVYVAGGTANFIDTEFSENRTVGVNEVPWLTLPGPGRGGGVSVASGQVYFAHCTFRQNVATGGQAVSWLPTIPAHPGAPGLGGGLYVAAGNVTLVRSTIMDNVAEGAAGAAAFGGGLWSDRGSLQIDASTVSGNRAAGGATLPNSVGNEAGGGGLYFANGLARISNSTISGNVAVGSDGTGLIPGGEASGGGIHLAAGTTWIDHTTIVANRAVRGSTAGRSLLPTVPIGGGGVFAGSTALVRMENSIVATNIAEHGSPDVAGATLSQGHNLIGDATGSTGFKGGLRGDLVGRATPTDDPIDPRLSPLEDNGGPTFTHRPLTDSPVIDGGSPNGASGFDQRGFPRVAGDAGLSDIGAVELAGPVAHIGGRYSVPEGGSVVLDASRSFDPERGPLIYDWDLYNNGVIEIRGRTIPLLTLSAEIMSQQGMGDNGEYPIGVVVQNQFGQRTRAATNILVTNVAPTVKLDESATGMVGVPVSLDLTAHDPSSADLVEGFDFTIDWGDGSVEADHGPFRLQVSHVYSAPGDFAIQVTATDKDGGTSEPVRRTVRIAPANTPPIVSIDPLVQATEGQPFELSGSFTDADSSSWTATVDFGHGSLEIVPLLPDRRFRMSHVFPTAGPYPVTVTITDAEGAAGTRSFFVPSNNVVPELGPIHSNASACGVVAAGQTVTLNGSFSGGETDTFEATVDWGDGTTSSADIAASDGSGTLIAEHKYAAPGLFPITLRLTDDDLSGDSTTLEALVTGVALQQGVLAIIGTDAAEVVTITASPTQLTVAAPTLGGTHSFRLTDVTKLTAALCGGNDRITVASNVSVPALLLGGAGNDRLSGGAGPSVLVGDDGADRLTGGSARDILIGGLGRDRVVGNGGDDILIGGQTTHDATFAALDALLTEWTSPRDHLARVRNLRDGTGDAVRENAGIFLDNQTVIDDGIRDILAGSADVDWFWSGALDTLADRLAAELIR
jgi:CSLREA domain-containing protein